ncbi:MAG: hypothetical protein NTU61_00850 [Candidatus Altiarchaeota archaeon]|nr:hypothetical protein [Candidatus Altiarchaeota archaeon]
MKLNAVVLAVLLLLFASASLALLVGFAVYMKQDVILPSVTTSTTVTSSTTSSSTSTSSTSTSSSSTLQSEEDLRKQEAIIRALNKKFTPGPLLNLSCAGEGGAVELWSDSVAFKVVIQNLASELTYVEVSAVTNRGVELEAQPWIYNLAPGETHEVFILVGDKDVRNGDQVNVTAKTLMAAKTITMPVERSSDKYTGVSKSGRDNPCGGPATYG